MPIVDTLLNAVLTAFAFLGIITVLVFVHELGHYWAAKACGMHVDAFAVMMGGVRKTDLKERLVKPLASAWVPWSVGGVAAGVTVAGAMADVQALFYAGMAFLAFVGPVWVILRLCHLYHVPAAVGIGTLLKSWGVIAVILFLGTQFRNLDLGYTLGMILAGSSVAVLLTYYLPVLRKPEDTPQGHGQVEIGGEAVPVIFRPVASVTNKEGTEFSILLLPLGGFAAIKGMHPKADGSEVRIEKGFYSRPAWQRFLVLFAGPLFSLLLGVALLVPTMVVRGVPEAIPVIGDMEFDAPAAKAGLLVGDRLVSVNGKEIAEFADFIEEVRFSYTEGEQGGLVPTPVFVGYERGGQNFTVEIVPTISETKEPIIDREQEKIVGEEHVARLGIRATTTHVPVSVGEAFVRAVRSPVMMTAHLFRMFGSYEVAKQSVGGPGQMIQQTGEAVKNGIWDVVEMAGALSIFLGVLNLLPVPPLDGGQMVIAFVEMLRGNRRLSPSVQGTLFTVGFFMVVLLMLVPFVIDSARRSEANRAADGAIEKLVVPEAGGR